MSWQRNLCAQCRVECRAAWSEQMSSMSRFWLMSGGCAHCGPVNDRGVPRHPMRSDPIRTAAAPLAPLLVNQLPKAPISMRTRGNDRICSARRSSHHGGLRAADERLADHRQTSSSDGPLRCCAATGPAAAGCHTSIDSNEFHAIMRSFALAARRMAGWKTKPAGCRETPR